MECGGKILIQSGISKKVVLINFIYILEDLHCFSFENSTNLQVAGYRLNYNTYVEVGSNLLRYNNIINIK
jgi:hypothetical protein